MADFKNPGGMKYDGPASLTPQQTTAAASGLGKIDDVLARVQQEGMKRTDSVIASPIKSAMGMKTPGPNPTVPGGIAWGPTARPVRQPG